LGFYQVKAASKMLMKLTQKLFINNITEKFIDESNNNNVLLTASRATISLTTTTTTTTTII